MTRDDVRLRARALDLWMLAVAPAIWSAYFLASYLTAAIWCAKVPDAGLAPVRGAVAWYTAFALAGIVAVGVRGFRHHDFGGATAPHDFDTPGDRRRFLGFATLLLAGLSAAATVFVALGGLFFERCR